MIHNKDTKKYQQYISHGNSIEGGEFMAVLKFLGGVVVGLTISYIADSVSNSTSTSVYAR